MDEFKLHVILKVMERGIKTEEIYKMGGKCKLLKVKRKNLLMAVIKKVRRGAKISKAVL